MQRINDIPVSATGSSQAAGPWMQAAFFVQRVQGGDTAPLVLEVQDVVPIRLTPDHEATALAAALPVRLALGIAPDGYSGPCVVEIIVLDPAGEEVRRYRLGLGLTELASIALAGLDLRHIARPHMQRLNELTRETVSLSIWDHDAAVMVEHLPALQPVMALGWVGLRDEVRPEARESLAGLMQSGVRRIAMVTGDRQPVAARVAREIGCEEVVADCLPQNKVEFVRNMKMRGYRVAVVGDGVNDAPALAAGDMGVAMGAAGSEVAIHSATIALMNSDLKRLPFLVRLSRSTRNVINQNFLFGVFFIIGGLTLAAFGYVNAIVAAIMHNLGSLLVVFNSARLVRQGEELEPFEARPESGRTPTAPTSPGEPARTPALTPQTA